VASRHDELRTAVVAFHKAHPVVWTLFDRFTRDRIRRGFEHYSVNAIFERIRWESDQAVVGAKEFKLNNNYRAFYARAWMTKNPKHDGFFRTRVQISKETMPALRPELEPNHFGYTNQ
jgi:hypothetical protein